MNEQLFRQLAFIKAFEIEFNQDEFNLMDNLEYNDEKFSCFQEVVEDEEINEKLDKYAAEIRTFIRNFEIKK